MIIRLKNIDNVNPYYIAYYLNSKIGKDYFDKNMIGAAQKNIGAGILERMPVVIPPIEMQNKIVNILDKFESLVNDITEGIPAEIELRRRQYEYYRNKLLSFEELCHE